MCIYMYIFSFCFQKMYNYADYRVFCVKKYKQLFKNSPKFPHHGCFPIPFLPRILQSRPAWSPPGCWESTASLSKTQMVPLKKGRLKDDLMWLEQCHKPSPSHHHFLKVVCKKHSQSWVVNMALFQPHFPWSFGRYLVFLWPVSVSRIH